MVPPVHQDSSIMPINTREEEFNLEEKDLLCTKKKPKFTGSIVQPLHEIEVHATQSSTNKELAARSRLAQLCSAIGWKHPTYDFEEQGLNHTKLFTCKVTVHVETFSDTVVECCSEPKPQKEAAQEQGAQGVLWCLKCLGHVK